MFRDRTNLFLSYRRTITRDVPRFDVDEEERFIGARKYTDNIRPDGSIELKPVVPSIFDIASELDGHLASIKSQVAELNSVYKKLIIIHKSDKKGLEQRIEDLNYNILKTFEKCYVLIKKIEFLNNNHERLQLNYNDGDLEILTNYKKNYAIKIQDSSLIFRNLQNNYIKFLRDEDDDLFETDSTTLLETTAEESSQIEQYSKQVLQQQNPNQQYLHQREREISTLAMGILEISTIFKEMESLVVDQGSILDRIDYNLTRTAQDLKSSDKELVKAQNYQKRTTKCKVIFFLTLVVFALFIIVLVKPHGTTKIVKEPATNAPDRPTIDRPADDSGKSEK